MAVDDLIVLMPHAIEAKAYDRAGGSFGRRSNFTATIGLDAQVDPAGWMAARETLMKYGGAAKAYHFSSYLGGLYMEVFFDVRPCDASRYYTQMLAAG